MYWCTLLKIPASGLMRSSGSALLHLVVLLSLVWFHLRQALPPGGKKGHFSSWHAWSSILTLIERELCLSLDGLSSSCGWPSLVQLESWAQGVLSWQDLSKNIMGRWKAYIRYRNHTTRAGSFSAFSPLTLCPCQWICFQHHLEWLRYSPMSGCTIIYLSPGCWILSYFQFVTAIISTVCLITKSSQASVTYC